ncbi:MAG TPA: PIN domain-containing protein [Vicinamibacterales bacterium]|nr:PIN domain-containing protein [Vicinamibacterales bacterium]
MNGYLFVRGVFVAVVVYAAAVIGPIEGHAVFSAALGLAVALGFVMAETRLRDAAVTNLLGGLIGFGVGLTIARMIGSSLFWANTSNTRVQFLHGLIIIVLPYLGLVLGARKGEWLEPAKFASLFRDARPQKRYKILDTSVIIDGRVADIVETGFLDGTLVVPQFVLKELQFVADSSDPLKRNRGRRGLDILHRIQKMSGVEVIVSDVDFPQVKEVDLKLIELARTLLGRIVTNDFNLNKVAQLRGVDVLNINELANSLKPVVLPGELMNVFILKEGKEYNQGVAYLDDGTMVVVDNARNRIGRNLDIVVTSVLQTTAGRMIFGRHAEASQGSTGDQAGREGRSDRDDSGRRPRPAAQA